MRKEFSTSPNAGESPASRRRVFKKIYRYFA
jgi:hypothetical protein